jgi:hypothetical protein
MTCLADEFPKSVSTECRNTALEMLGIAAHLRNRIRSVDISPTSVTVTVMRVDSDGQPVIVSSPTGREISTFDVRIVTW